MKEDKSTIVLVEDNPADTYLIRRALDVAGVSCHLHVIEDGAEALRFAEQCPEPSTVDLLLLDMNLPKSEGREVLAVFRNNDRWDGVKVAVITSSQSPRERERVMALGVEKFLVKPPDLDEFLQIGHEIKAMLQKGLASGD